jgi:hypothetical protein
LRKAAICAAMTLGLCMCQVDVALGVLQGLLGGGLGFGGLGFVKVVAAHRRVGQHGHSVRLDFEDAAGDEDELLAAAVGLLDAHGARLDAGDEWRVARQDAELAALARQGDELGLAGVDALLGGNHVNVDGSGH